MVEDDVLRQTASWLEKTGEWQKAVEVRAQIAGHPDSDSRDRFFHARALLYAGQLSEAQSLIATLPSGDEDPATLMLRADLKERTSEHAEAERLWTQALQAGGPVYWCLFGRARALVQLHRVADANSLMKRALVLGDGEKQGMLFALSLQQAVAINSSALTDVVAGEIKNALLETYFKDRQPEAAELDDHTRLRFDACVGWFIPWLKRYADLQRASVVEIGCGTGSTTAAIASHAASVDAYDIDELSVDAARRRAEIMKLENARFHAHPPDVLLDRMLENHPPETVDCVVLFAVLEHQLYEERVATLKACWDVLRPGGILAIADTPNRLCWHDFHTSWLPFFNMLPDDVAVDYSDRAPRDDFREAISNARSISQETALDTLARLGRGVSYHEFELAIGDIDQLIVGDGFDPEPLAYFGISLETRLLYTYKRRKPLNIPAAFVRDTIEVILRKPDPGRPPIKRRSLKELDATVQPLQDVTT